MIVFGLCESEPITEGATVAPNQGIPVVGFPACSHWLLLPDWRLFTSLLAFWLVVNRKFARRSLLVVRFTLYKFIQPEGKRFIQRGDKVQLLLLVIKFKEPLAGRK